MWMFYSEQSWPKAVDLESSVHRLYSELRDLQFDAEHETVYNSNVFCDEEETRRLKELAESYLEGLEVCELYLCKDISLECLCYEFVKLNLTRFLYGLKQFMPHDLGNKFCPCDCKEASEEDKLEPEQNTTD